MDLQIFDAQRKALFREKRQGITGSAHEHAARIVDGILVEMRDALDREDAPKAFSLGVLAKSFRLSVRNLDLLRARAFSRMGRIPEAEQSLREELRHFPDNSQAARLLEGMLQGRPPAAGGVDECDELIALVRDYTMLGEARLRSLYTLARTVCEKGVPGDFVECGVAGGGSSALLAMVIARHSKCARTLYSLDTFEGMPDSGEMDMHQGTPAEATGWGAGTCAAPESAVRGVFEKLGVSGIVKTVKGLFQDTLPVLRAQLALVAFLHLDGDWYDSTMTVLVNLDGRYAPGALIQIDDYGYWEGCSKAVHEFERDKGVRFDLHVIDDTGVWCEAPEPRQYAG